MRTTKRTGPLLLTVTLATLSGCFGGGKPAQFYLLDALPQDVPAPAPHENLAGKTLGLGPIHFPRYLNRPQIVSATSSVRYSVDDDHRWAERLEENFARVLYENLSALLPMVHFLRHPWRRSATPDLTVSLDVLKFHSDARGIGQLLADWRIFRDGKLLFETTSNIRVPANADDYEAMVQAQSRCVSRLSAEIADAIVQYAALQPPR